MKQKHVKPVALCLAALLLIACLFAGLVACDDTNDNNDVGKFDGIDQCIHPDMLDAYINGGLSYCYSREDEYPYWSIYAPLLLSNSTYTTSEIKNMRYNWVLYSYNSDNYGTCLFIYGFDTKEQADAAENELNTQKAFLEEEFNCTLAKTRPYENVIVYENKQGLFDEIKNSKMPEDKIPQKKLDFINNAVAKELKSVYRSLFTYQENSFWLQVAPIIGNCTREYYAEADAEYFSPSEEGFTSDSYIEKDGDTYYTFLQTKPGLRFSESTDHCDVNGFYYDTETATVEIPSEYNGKPVTSINIYNRFGDHGITSITIPNCVSSVQLQNDFSKLKTIIFKGTINEWKNVFCKFWNVESDFIIHCTDGDLNKDGIEI